MKTNIDSPEFERMSGMNGNTTGAGAGNDKPGSIRIFGMKPWVAGLVAISVIGVVIFATRSLTK